MKKTRQASVLEKMFLTAFATTALIELSTVGSGLIDGIIISRFLGADSMAALGIAYPFFSIAGIGSGVLAVGMKLMNGSELARGNIHQVRRNFTMTMIIGLAVSLVLSVPAFGWTDAFSRVLGARGNAAELMGDTSAYLRGLNCGCLPLILNVILADAVHMDSGSRLVQIGAVAGAAADIVFDILAVRLGWGMFGMGLATAVAQFVEFFILLLHFAGKEAMLGFSFDRLPWNRTGKLLSLGSGKASRRLFNFIRPVLLNAMIIAAGGAMGMSALSVRNNIGDFLEIPMTGIAEAVELLAAIAYGEKNKEECRQVGKLAQKYALISGGAILLLLAVGGRWITDFFVGERGELHRLVQFSMYCLAGGTLFTTLLSSRISYLQATRQMKKNHLLVFLNRLGSIVPCAGVCVLLWGSWGVILSFTLSDMLICLGIFIFYICRCIAAPKEAKKKLPPTADDYLALPEDFNVKPQDIIELSVINREEAVLSAEQLQLFCRGHKFDEKRARNAALCLEELTANIIEHGFPTCKSVQPIDIRVVLDDDTIIMKVRDHCPLYDINNIIRTVESDTDPSAYMGMKIIAKTAKDISYVSMLESNVTIIRI